MSPILPSGVPCTPPPLSTMSCSGSKDLRGQISAKFRQNGGPNYFGKIVKCKRISAKFRQNFCKSRQNDFCDIQFHNSTKCSLRIP